MYGEEPEELSLEDDSLPYDIDMYERWKACRMTKFLDSERRGKHERAVSEGFSNVQQYEQTKRAEEEAEKERETERAEAG